MHRNCGNGSASWFSSQGFRESSPCANNPHPVDVSGQKSLDRIFIDGFIKNALGGKLNKPKVHPVSITLGKKILLEIIKRKKNLSALAADMFVQDKNFDKKWKTLCREAEELNDKVLDFDKNIKMQLIKTTMKRLKKRKWERNKRLKLKALKEEFKTQVSEKHAFIDEWLYQRKNEVEAEKRKAALKLQADSVLHGVRRKISEAKKMLNLLSALSKLRDLRQKHQESRGEHSSRDSDETFLYAIGKFQKLWENQIEVYKTEEKKLNGLLEEDTSPLAREAELENCLKKWEQMLFGNEELQIKTGSNISALVQVRKEWDGFLAGDTTLMASSLPSGWVLPSDSQWEKLTSLPK